MDFINWWFVTHWIWATILTPGLTFLYAIFSRSTGWAVAAACVWLLFHLDFHK